MEEQEPTPMTHEDRYRHLTDSADFFYESFLADVDEAVQNDTLDENYATVIKDGLEKLTHQEAAFMIAFVAHKTRETMPLMMVQPEPDSNLILPNRAERRRKERAVRRFN